MEIDDRKNYFMLGVTISILSHVKHSIWYILICVLIITLWNFIVKKTKSIGDGDISGMTWIYLGYAFIGISSVLWFLIIIISLTIVYFFFKLLVFKYRKSTPYFPVILISYICTNLILNIY